MENEAKRALFPEALKENLPEQSGKATVEAWYTSRDIRGIRRSQPSL